MKEGQWDLDPAVRNDSGNMEAGIEYVPVGSADPPEVSDSTAAALGGIALAGSTDDSFDALIADLDSFVEAGYSDFDSSSELETAIFTESTETDASESSVAGGESQGDFGSFG